MDKNNRGSPKLTVKQEKFIEGILKGKSQRQAFIDAGYSSEGKTSEYLDSKACIVFNDVKVQARYHSIMEERKKKTLWSLDRAVIELVEMLEDSKVDKSYTGRYNAIKELNTLEALYPKEADFNMTPSNIAEYINGLTPEQLEEVMKNVKV